MGIYYKQLILCLIQYILLYLLIFSCCFALYRIYGGVAKRGAAFGQGSGPVWMDNVQCMGDEESLVKCPNSGLGMHDCDHSKDAGVQCFTSLQTTEAVQLSTWPPTSTTTISTKTVMTMTTRKTTSKPQISKPCKIIEFFPHTICLNLIFLEHTSRFCQCHCISIHCILC